MLLFLQKFFLFFLDPNCFTYLESIGSQDSYGKRYNIFRVTNWVMEFCQHLAVSSSHQLKNGLNMSPRTK